LVKGTTKGTNTDGEGAFKISVAPGSTLVLSAIGFVRQEITPSGVTMNVAMAQDVAALSEVVVVGYGTQKKETVTGSVVSVKGTDLVKSPAMNLSNSLAGRLPGVTAVNRSGLPGGDGSAIRIRGSNTLNSTGALIVIDGIPNRAGGLDRLNPADIESISVLKDAAAAIYGSRAANGVILVTTKRGKAGKPELSYTINQGWSNPTVLTKLTNAAQYTGMLNDLDIYALPTSEWAAANQAYKSTGTFTRPNGTVRNAPFSPQAIQKYADGSDPWNFPNTDWFGATLKNWSPQVRHNLQLNGGTENFSYLASLGYQNQDANYIQSSTGYKQFDMRLNFDAKINKYVTMTLGVVGRQEARRYSTQSPGSIFRMLMRGKPQEPAFWPDGRPGPDIENGQNPVVITTDLAGYDSDTRNYFQSNGQLDIKIPGIEGLKLSVNAAVDNLSQNNKTWLKPWTLFQKGSGVDANGNPNLVAARRGPADPSLNQANINQLNILLGTVLTYDKTFGNHTLNLLAGTNRETIKGDNFSAFRRFFLSTALDQMFAGGDLQRNNNGGAFNTARINYFGRVGYNFKEKYLAEFLWRYDGSDIFPKETRYGFFPGIMAGWVISEESFFKKALPAVNFLKLRGSIGQMGNDQIPSYQYLSTYGFRSYILGNAEEKTLFEARIPNTSITWEVATNSNLGLEGQMFNGNVFFEFDVFSNKRTNILWTKNASVPQSTGLTLPRQNLGEVLNKGWEFNIGYRNQKDGFKYNVSVNGGYAQNKILFWDEAPGAPAWQQTTGKPMFTYQTYQYDGVFKDQASIDANPIDYKAIVNTLRPGDMKYKDYNSDGKITPDDQVRTNFTNIPLFTGGFNLSASYKNFDLTVLIQGAAGARQFISTGEMGNIGNFFSEVYENRWTIDNPSDTHPRIANRNDQYYSSGNDYWLRNTDYIRLKNLEVGYNIPNTLVKKIGMNTLRVYFNGLNLLTASKMKAFDPEADNAFGQYYPQQKILNVGLVAAF